jgi:hypothetical protein
MTVLGVSPTRIQNGCQDRISSLSLTYEELRPASGRAGAAIGASRASRTPECGTLCCRNSRRVGVSPNTVILDNNYGSLADSCARACASLPHRELGARFRFNSSLPAPTSTAPRYGFSKMPAHLREYPRSCFRGKCSGPDLFAWI